MNYVAKELQRVVAWKYETGVGVPIWVARKCHDLGDGKLTANTLVGRLPIEIGDYVTLVNAETNSICVVRGADFEAQFEPEEK